MRAILALALCGCAHRPPPDRAALTTTAAVADALARGDLAAIDARVSRRSAGDRASRLRDRPEVDAEVARLRAALRGAMNVHAEVRLSGPSSMSALLEQDRDGWRVDPERVGIAAPTPAAAIELVIEALERLPSDPALALLSAPLREGILRSARDRIDGLREVLPAVQRDGSGRLSIQVDYARGLFVVVRQERGQWRVDDFN